MEKKVMKRTILFPYRLGDDNRKGFAFTVELARKSNADIIALTSLELGEHHTRKRKKRQRLMMNKKNQIYGNLLELQGVYHGRYNQWNAFAEIKIHSQIVNDDMNAAICAAIDEHPDLIIVLQQPYFSGTGLYEEIFSHSFEGQVNFFMLPQNKAFDVASPNLKTRLFNKH
jgi:hypothetical protein